MAFREVRMLPIGVRIDVIAEFAFTDHAVGSRVVRLRVNDQCLQAEFVFQIGDHVLCEIVFRFDENITSKVMNNVLLDLMMAYEQLNDKLSDNTELKKLKAADTKSVKRGKWFNPPGKARCETHCTRCYGKIMKDQTGAYIETLFCPHCGADMRVPIE